MSDLPTYDIDTGEEPALEEQLAKLAIMKAKYKRLQDDAEFAKEEHDVEQAKVFAAMRDRGLLTIKTDSGTFSAKSTIYGNVNDMEAFKEWAMEHHLAEDFVKDAPESKRLNELVRTAIDNGEELPPGVNWYPRDYISISNT